MPARVPYTAARAGLRCRGATIGLGAAAFVAAVLLEIADTEQHMAWATLGVVMAVAMLTLSRLARVAATGTLLPVVPGTLAGSFVATLLLAFVYLAGWVSGATAPEPAWIEEVSLRLWSLHVASVAVYGVIALSVWARPEPHSRLRHAWLLYAVAWFGTAVVVAIVMMVDYGWAGALP
jgi:hypothetical protein